MIKEKIKGNFVLLEDLKKSRFKDNLSIFRPAFHNSLDCIGDVNSVEDLVQNQKKNNSNKEQRKRRCNG